MYALSEYVKKEDFNPNRIRNIVKTFSTFEEAMNELDKRHTIANWYNVFTITETSTKTLMYYIEGGQAQDYRNKDMMKGFQKIACKEYIKTHSNISIKDEPSEKGSTLRKFHVALYKLALEWEKALKEQGLCPIEPMKADGTLKQSDIHIRTYVNRAGKRIGAVTFYNGGEAIRFHIDENSFMNQVKEKSPLIDHVTYNPKVFIPPVDPKYVGFVPLHTLEFLNFKMKPTLQPVYDYMENQKLLQPESRTPEYLFYTYVKDLCHYGRYNDTMKNGTKRIYISDFKQNYDGDFSTFRIYNHDFEAVEISLRDQTVFGMSYIYLKNNQEEKTPLKSSKMLNNLTKDFTLIQYAKNCINLPVPALHMESTSHKTKDGTEILNTPSINMDIIVEDDLEEDDFLR